MECYPAGPLVESLQQRLSPVVVSVDERASMELGDVEVDTWLDTLARYAGFDAVVERFDVAPSTAAIVAVVVFDIVGLNVLRVLSGKPVSFVRNPLSVVIPLTMLFGVIISRDIHRRYQFALKEMHLERRTDSPGLFRALGGNRLRWGLWCVGAAVIYFNGVFLLTVPVIVETDGVAGLIGNFVLNPLVYVPVAVDFLAAFVAVQILLPRRIRNSDFELDFLDPEGLGGLRPVGELVKHTYYYFVIGMVAVALFVYGPWLFGGTFDAPVEPSSFINTLFTVAWLVGAGFVAHALYVFHRFMNEEKRERLHELNEQYRTLAENPYSITEHSIPEERTAEAEEIRNRMDQITSTNEYPATFSMWTQLLIGIVLPKALQMFLAFLSGT